LKEDNPIGQEIAMDTLFEYAEKIEHPEKEAIQAYVKEKSADKDTARTLANRGTRVKPMEQAPASFWSRLMAMLQKLAQPASLNIVADKLEQEHSDNDAAFAIGAYLRRFPDLFMKMKIGLGVVGFLLLILLLSMCG